jgi:hypothetical protein
MIFISDGYNHHAMKIAATSELRKRGPLAVVHALAPAHGTSSATRLSHASSLSGIVSQLLIEITYIHEKQRAKPRRWEEVPIIRYFAQNIFV